MPPDPTVVDAMRASVAAAPENVALRLHLVGLLVESELWAEAQEQLAVVLAARPNDLEAVSLAATAADGLGHDVLDMWLGKSEQNLHAIFETARRHAPCVLFLDEVDALGLKRSNLSHSAGRNVVVQLLSELDSTRSDNEGLFVLGATNQPWDLDPALRRPGRFDRSLLVLPPDEPARAAILAYHLRDPPVAADLDIERLAKRTDGYSG